MTKPETFVQRVLRARQAGNSPIRSDFEMLSKHERQVALHELIQVPDGRRWIRRHLVLDEALANELLGFARQDFTVQQRDRSLKNVVAVASIETLIEHVEHIAAGSGAFALWSRLSERPDLLAAIANQIMELEQQPNQAARSTIALLVLDPAGEFNVPDADVTAIAGTGLRSPDAEVRGMAAEYLAGAVPATLATTAQRLTLDESERVRTHTWTAAFQTDASMAHDLGIELLGNEGTSTAVRTSALLALGLNLPTTKLEDLLSFFVLHPNERLALEAANLLFRHHRSATIAMTALESPHEPVRDIARRLMDPYRGSPAAGGSRPGDPVSTDIYARMLRNLESDETDTGR